ncbi:hypothetical protein IGI04_001064, partial [Brassica rapa subsp. trilocularis]
LQKNPVYDKKDIRLSTIRIRFSITITGEVVRNENEPIRPNITASIKKASTTEETTVLRPKDQNFAETKIDSVLATSHHSLLSSSCLV